MKRLKKTLWRGFSLVLAAAVLAAVPVAQVSAAPYGVSLRMTADILPPDVIFPDEVLELSVSARADFPVYSNYTMIYYDRDYFAPCSTDGTPFTAAIQGGNEGAAKIGGYLQFDAANPLHQVVSTIDGHGLVGDLNVTNLADYPAAWKDASGALKSEYAHYAVIAVKAPCETTTTPASSASVPAETPWFKFYMKALAETPAGQTADIFFAPEALRGSTNPTGPMHFNPAPSSEGSDSAAISLSAALQYTIAQEVPGAITVTVAAANGTPDVTALRNVVPGTTFEEIRAQLDQLATAVTGTQGYGFAFWSLDGVTPLEYSQEITAGMTLTAVCTPLVTFSFFDEDGVTPLLDPLTGPQGTACTMPSNPTKVGYTFNGWSAAPAAFDQNRNIVASWTPKSVKVTLVIMDLSQPEGSQRIVVEIDSLPEQLQVGTSLASYIPADLLSRLSSPPDAAAGYALEIFSAAAVTATDSPAIDVEIARVHRGTWFVTYNTGGGTAVARQEKQRGVPLTLAGTPVLSGYTFMGWAETTGGPAVWQPGNSYTADADLALHAVWQVASSDPGGGGGGGGSIPTPTPTPTPTPKKIFTTHYDATFINWILFILLFGWIWMWF